MRVVLKDLRAAEILRANAQASQDRAGEPIARRPRGLAAKCVHVFLGRKAGHPIGIDASMKPLKKLDLPFHARGFRSSFSNWAHERTNFATEIVEASLAAHGWQQVERAYRAAISASSGGG